MVFDYFKTQSQQKLVWPASVALARAYVDQLARAGGLTAPRIGAARQVLASAENASAAQRRDALTQLGDQVDGDDRASGDAALVRMLAGAVRGLAAASR